MYKYIKFKYTEDRILFLLRVYILLLLIKIITLIV